MNEAAVGDSTYPERLKAGFMAEYKRLRADNNLEGDALFYRLFDFASGDPADFTRRAAGLAVLVYLFTACEVFDK